MGGDLGLPGDGGFLYRLNDLDGSVVWRKDYANGVLTSAPAVDANEDVYIWAREGNQANVHAYDLNGNPLWSLTVHDNSFFGRDIGYGNSVALANGYLFVSNGVLDSDPSYTPATPPFLFAIHD